MIRPMKWHIFNEYDEPLCWEDQAMEFDTKESAERLLHSHVDYFYDNFEEYCQTFGVTIKEGILYYDGGYLDCTHKIVKYNEETDDGELVDVD